MFKVIAMILLTSGLAGGPGGALARATHMQDVVGDEAVGFWNLHSGAQSKHCDIAIFPAAEGRRVRVENCKVGDLARSVRWAPATGGFSLLDPDGAVLMRFRRVDVDRFDSVGSGYILSRGTLS